MDLFAKQPYKDRDAVFKEAATRRGLLHIIIEKDFWVCWVLKHLYSIAELSPHITFKGGTSLSKAYGLIDRFSEDIDLTISKPILGVTGSADPLEANISNNERDRRIDTLKMYTQRFVNEKILPKLQTEFQHSLETEKGWRLTLDDDDKDRQTILFFYPQSPENTQTMRRYITPHVKLEFGARGDPIPSTNQTITPYVADEFPQIFNDRTCLIPTLAAERTFWEKATILHSIHYGVKLHDRMSRHYYDTYKLITGGIAEAALQDPSLRDQS